MFQCPHGLELLHQKVLYGGLIMKFQCPHGLELLPEGRFAVRCLPESFNALTGLSCYSNRRVSDPSRQVSMPSRAWVITITEFTECRFVDVSMPSRAWVITAVSWAESQLKEVSMPSRAWVITARMSNILNFLWYFLCIPAIYKCILAYLSIFFNQLSEFLRCESPSTFLGTCLSHHSFIWW